MKNEKRLEALEIILKAQENCLNVKISIGGVNEHGIVEHDSLYILECPAIVINQLINKGFSLSMVKQGLSVNWYKS